MLICACCSSIAVLQNPDTNPTRMSGYATVVYGAPGECATPEVPAARTALTAWRPALSRDAPSTPSKQSDTTTPDSGYSSPVDGTSSQFTGTPTRTPSAMSPMSPFGTPARNPPVREFMRKEPHMAMVQATVEEEEEERPEPPEKLALHSPPQTPPPQPPEEVPHTHVEAKVETSENAEKTALAADADADDGMRV